MADVTAAVAAVEMIHAISEQTTDQDQRDRMFALLIASSVLSPENNHEIGTVAEWILTGEWPEDE